MMFVFVVLIFWLLFSPAVFAEEPSECIKIRDIKIHTQDVYEDDDSPNWFESSVNFLHFTTRDHVVEKELLFSEKDCLDTELVEESARNLRALPIFSDATIRIERDPDENVADIVVTTKDRFTFRGEISVSHKAGETSGRISLGEKNFLGLNKEVLFLKLKDGDEEESEYVYRDPRFFTDYVLYTAYTSADDGERQNYSIQNPFRSLDDPLSFGASYYSNNQNFEYNLDDAETIEVPQNYEGFGLNYRRELGDRKHSFRVGGSIGFSRQDYFAEGIEIANETVPSDVDRYDLSFSASYSFRDDFIELQGLDSLIYREDIALGSSVSFRAGVQRRENEEGTQYHQKYRLGYGYTHYVGEQFLSSLSWNSGARMYAGNLMETNTTAFYHGYYLPKPGHVVLGGVAYKYRYGRDILNKPLTMGGDLGLRGYKAGTFTGNKTVLFNMEYRHRLPVDWQQVGLGQVFFVDSGYAWKHGDRINLKDLQTNVGYGLRFDIPSFFGANVLRMDLAVATETGDVLATVVLGQIFRYNQLAEI